MEDYKKFAINLAKEAGEIMKKNFTLGMAKEWKSDNSPVTETDIAINRMLIEGVKKNFPGHSVLAEEESDMVENSEYVWVCDPLDGTLPFSHGVPIFTFSLALVRDGSPILGVIYDPIMDRMFIAEKGKGAFLNGKKISVSKAVVLMNAVMNIDGGGDEIGRDIVKLTGVLKAEKVKTFRFISIIYGGALTAAGEFSGTIFLRHTVHDVAAMKIIIEEAGGKVTDVNGNEQRYDRDINGIIASNGLLHDKLVALVNEK